MVRPLMRCGRSAVLLVSLGAFACGETASNGGDDATGGVASGPALGGSGGTGAGGAAGSGAGTQGGASTGGSGAVTWSEHVAPIVYRSCVGCHREGGIAPFSLTGYERAHELSASMAYATSVRYMPPMPVDNSGSCNTYSNARWLSDAEIATIGAWNEAGAPEGDPSRTPPVPPPPAGLAHTDLTLDPGESYTPNAALTDDYRCFVIDPGLTTSTYLVAWDMVPGNPSIVHHAIVYAPESNEEALAAEALDAAESGLGYTCFGSAGVDATPVVLWAPGGGVVNLPEGTGVQLAAGRKLVLQIHYNLAPGAFPDRTTVRLQTAATVERPGTFTAIADLSLEVPPGQEHAVSTRTFDLGEPLPSAMVYGVLPHMHTLGRTLRLEATIPALGADSTCLVNVDRWNFNWQNAWWYDTPIVGTGATSFTLSCGYDTRERTMPVTWGEGTEDEMCIVYLYNTL
jgi:hypothetical protein